VLGMRVELGVYTALASAATMGAEALDMPVTAKMMAIAAGTMFGAFAASLAFQNATPMARVTRGLLSIFVGPVITLVWLAQWPTAGGFDRREWAFVAAAVCAFFAWAIARMAQKYGPQALDVFADRAAKKYGVDIHGREKRLRAAKKAAAKDEHEEGGI